MSRLLIVSNRLPVTVQLDASETLRVVASPGGLASGLTGPHERSGGLWIGWPGDVTTIPSSLRADLEAQLTGQRLVPVYLSKREIDGYYTGFANGVLWPLFHYLVTRLPRHPQNWPSYAEVNRRFAQIVCQHHQPGDLIWVQDYQLMLVPGLVREQIPEARIGFFLHIPFPAAEVLRILPWREELMRGLAGADLVGFHTLSYLHQFSEALVRILGVMPDIDRVVIDGRTVRLGAFPMGIDAQEFARLANDRDVRDQAQRLREEHPGQRLLLGVDRLDYTKGIPRRLRAVERLLESEPSWRGRLRFIQVAVPSRTDVPEYETFSDEVHQLVGRINGAYSTPASVPIHFIHRNLTRTELVALYLAADVMLVTPLRDGMNLVAKEFAASRADEDGVLVLSEFAGAASEMGEALQVNPYDIEAVAATISRALAISRGERRKRIRALRERVLRYDVHRWAETFLSHLETAAADRGDDRRRLTSAPEIRELATRLRAAPRITWLLDYDGTLVPFASRPELAEPDEELRAVLAALARDPRMRVHIVSGRPHELLQEWFGTLPIGLHAEHGLWSRMPGDRWTASRDIDVGWKPRVRAILEQFELRVPGSLVEEKTASLAWHYRSADLEFGEHQARELKLHLAHALSNIPIEILSGDKVVEVQPHGVNKGAAVRRLASELTGALVVAIGDDETDENMFTALPEGAISIHVGPRASIARYRLRDHRASRRLLQEACASSGDAGGEDDAHGPSGEDLK